MQKYSKIVVISLSTAEQRRKDFESSAPTNIEWSYFDACTTLVPPLTYDENIAKSRNKNVQSKGELGVWSSHYSLWKLLVDSEFLQMIIFEDDVAVDWPFIEKLSNIDFGRHGINYLKLFTKIPARWCYIKTPFLDKYHHLIRFTNHALGMQAYIITREGAKKLLQYTQVDCAVDRHLDKYWVHGIPNLGIYPFHVFEKFVPSSLGDSRLEPVKLTFGQSFRYAANRAWDKGNILLNEIGVDRQRFKKMFKNLPDSW